jgi:hypothetical protein
VRGKEVGFKGGSGQSRVGRGRERGRGRVSTHGCFAAQGKTALIRAAEDGNEALVKQLIAAKANLNATTVSYRSGTQMSLPQCL